MIDLEQHRLFGLRKAAELLDCSRTSVYAYVRSGRLKSKKVGGVIKTCKQWCSEFLQPVVDRPAGDAIKDDDPHGLHD